MKKIIRLTESDLIRIVKKVIKEQSSPVNAGLKNSKSSDMFVGKTVNFYMDKENTKLYPNGEGKIVKTNLYNMGGKEGPTFSFDNQPNVLFVFDCTTKYFKNVNLIYAKDKSVIPGFYNKNLADKVFKMACSQGKVDFASTTDIDSQGFA